MSDSAAGWQPDPTGKHDHRYWDGTGWTDNVADGGVAGTDPYEAVRARAASAEPTAGSQEPTVVTPVEARRRHHRVVPDGDDAPAAPPRTSRRRRPPVETAQAEAGASAAW